MVDIMSPERRSQMMGRIRGKDTTPELTVRRLLRSLGVGYRLHVRDLPGRPDIVMVGRRRIIEVRGCFWHRHPGCRLAYTPKSRIDFWTKKFADNVARDERNDRVLMNSGWSVLTVWECETEAGSLLLKKVVGFLGLDGERVEEGSGGSD